jgi:hypothetical protein
VPLSIDCYELESLKREELFMPRRIQTIPPASWGKYEMDLQPDELEGRGWSLP